MKWLKWLRGNRVKTPTVLQMEAVECGATALGIILEYYGRVVPLEELRTECGVSRDGSKASNVLKAARRYGLVAKGFKKGLEALKKLQPPYVVFWNFNHFLVVEGITDKWVYLNDPAHGRRIVTPEEFDEGFTGVVLVMEPGEEFEAGGRRPSVVKALASRMGNTLWGLLFCILAGFFLTIPSLAMPIFSQVFIDHVLVQGRVEWLKPILTGMLITTVISAVLSQLQFRHLRNLKIKLALGMTGRFLWHILRLPMSFYAQRFAGEISGRSQLNKKIAGVISGQLSRTLIDCVMLGFYVIVMLQYDVILTVLGVSFALCNVVMLQVISKLRVAQNMRLQNEAGKLAGLSVAGLQSIETIKASALESSFFSRWAGYYAKNVNTNQEVMITNQKLSLLPTLFGMLTNMAMVVVGGLRVIDGHLTIGTLVAFQAMMGMFQGPVGTLVAMGTTLQGLRADLMRLDDVLRHPIDPDAQRLQDERIALEQAAYEAEVRGEEAQPTVGVSRLEGRVALAEITYGYSHISPPLIDKLSLELEPGQRVALVGGSGSGKSTVARIIAGLYQPWSGKVLLDNKAREDWPRDAIINSVAMVDQDILLFGGTVRDNLTLWDRTIPEERLVDACKDAAIWDVVLSMPGGLEAHLLEGGANLSGGQRQRLEIARALVQSPSVLIMDEATSALDAETEMIIDRNLRRRGCTCIIVAHRLSTIRDADEIVVLHHGKVVQRGTHQELWQSGGAYAAMLRSVGEAMTQGAS